MAKITYEATYDGHNTKRDGIISLNFRVPYTELSNGVKSVMLVDKQFKVAVIVDGQKIKIAKSAAFCGLRIDRHGETRITLETDVASMLCTFDDIRVLVNKSMTVYCLSGSGGDASVQ